MQDLSFFWHDYETFGRVPRRDRPAQFAGIRTDAELREIDAPVMHYCRPAPDYLPDPESCLLTGILPQLLEFPDVTPGTECSGVASVKYQAANLRPFRDFPENTIEVTEHLPVDEVERTAV